jgi:DNA-binding NarL/FixJ family response regulator
MLHPRRRRLVRSHRWRVLLVEDDESFARALTKLVEADGRLEVAGTARDGREGVELAEALRPDVVLMDIVLPVMDGVEATREIRRRQPTIQVVGITGLAYEERARDVSNAGAVAFVDKSIFGPALIEIVVAAAQGRGRRRSHRPD